MDKHVFPLTVADRLRKEIVISFEMVLNATGQRRIESPEAAIIPTAKFRFLGDYAG